MSKYLATFSGHRGDILWSLATARELAEMVGEAIDFGIMPQFRDMLPLLATQMYIDRAYAIDDWICTGEPHGCQPWQPPEQPGYVSSWHLTYRAHPGINDVELPLIDYIAHQQGIRFKANPLPFLSNGHAWRPGLAYVAYGFNPQFQKEKASFLGLLKYQCPHVDFVDTTELPWMEATSCIAHAICFVGCRSSNHVLAHGVGQKVIEFEPHPSRNAYGHLGKVFGCPYGKSFSAPFNQVIELQAQQAAKLINQWREEYEDANATTKSR